jgi:hypothetical protein
MEQERQEPLYRIVVVAFVGGVRHQQRYEAVQQRILGGVACTSIIIPAIVPSPNELPLAEARVGKWLYEVDVALTVEDEVFLSRLASTLTLELKGRIDDRFENPRPPHRFHDVSDVVSMLVFVGVDVGGLHGELSVLWR